MASLLSDRILDEILESLSRSQHTLVSVHPSLCPSVPLSIQLSASVLYWPPLVWVQADHVTRRSQPLVRQEAQTETEVVDEVVLKDQEQGRVRDQNRGLEDLDPCMVVFYKLGLIWSLTGTSSNVLVSPFR